MNGFLADPSLVWRFYSERRRGVSEVEPNAGHAALVDLERKLGDRFLLTTQNVDGLHARAGSKRMVELHGNLCMTRCLRCDRAPFEDKALYFDALPECEDCAASGHTALLRPHIVWFGEALDGRVLMQVDAFIRDAGEDLLFLAIGTSGSVFPAASLVDVVRRAGGTSYLINLEEAANASKFEHVITGKSGEVLPELLSF